ncbi:MAG: biliverdin-producing heme oxygenase [Alteripontixanthobacter sp.]
MMEDRKSAANSARFVLRSATRAEHDATEHALAHLSIEKPAHYTEFLRIQVRSLAIIEPALAGGGWTRWQSRMPQLELDLADLDAAILMSPATPADFPADAHIWGAQYVLEGSRLGGQMLCRRVQPGLPTRYLNEPDSTATWRRFVEAMECAAEAVGDLREEWLQDAVTGAKKAFMIFQAAAQAAAQNTAQTTAQTTERVAA